MCATTSALSWKRRLFVVPGVTIQQVADDSYISAGLSPTHVGILVVFSSTNAYSCQRIQTEHTSTAGLSSFSSDPSVRAYRALGIDTFVLGVRLQHERRSSQRVLYAQDRVVCAGMTQRVLYAQDRVVCAGMTCRIGAGARVGEGVMS